MENVNNMTYKYFIINIFIIVSLLAFQIILGYEVGKFRADANPLNRLHRWPAAETTS